MLLDDFRLVEDVWRFDEIYRRSDMPSGQYIGIGSGRYDRPAPLVIEFGAADLLPDEIAERRWDLTRSRNGDFWVAVNYDDTRYIEADNQEAWMTLMQKKMKKTISGGYIHETRT